ncbi:MAG: acyl-CoA dehydrogenase family protein [Pseudomonadota bacterium]
MNFEFTDEQKMLRETVRKFVDREMPVEKVREWDNKEITPPDLYKKMAEVGFLGSSIPEEYGGSGGGVIEEAIITEELSVRSSSCAMLYGLAVCFGALTIERQGTKEQKDYFLPRIIKGDVNFALSLTEPYGGTDILGTMRSKAEQDGDFYVINGTKVFTTGASVATHLFVVVRTDRTEKKSFGLTIFLTPKETPGITLNKIEKLGSKIMPSFEVIYDNVRVPKDIMIGGRGTGWYTFLDTLNNERINIGATCVGIGQGAFEIANQYAKERIAFERPIGQFQAVQHQLADTMLEIELARLITYKAAWMQSQGMNCAVEASMSKYYASEAAFRATDRGMRIMAGFGFTMEYDMQRYYRDIRQFIFAPITNEMNRNFIGQVGCGLPKSY